MLGLAAGSQSNKDGIIAACAVPRLVALLRSPQPDVQGNAAGALWNLAAGSQQNRDTMIEAGAMPLLDAVLRASEPAVQLQAAGALRCLCGAS